MRNVHGAAGKPLFFLKRSFLGLTAVATAPSPKFAAGKPTLHNSFHKTMALMMAMSECASKALPREEDGGDNCGARHDRARKEWKRCVPRDTSPATAAAAAAVNPGGAHNTRISVHNPTLTLSHWLHHKEDLEEH